METWIGKDRTHYNVIKCLHYLNISEKSGFIITICSQDGNVNDG